MKLKSLQSLFTSTRPRPTSPVRRAFRPATLEALESRIAPAVLAGIGTGLHKTSVAFYDADGDRIDIAISGRGYFDVTLDGGKTNRADIDHITIKGATAASSFAVRVLSNAAGGGTVTPGATSINSVTSDYTGAMVGISFLSAEVQDLDLGNVSLKGGLSLGVANVLRADLLNAKALSGSGTTYEALAPGVDFHNINLASAASITISGGVGKAGDLFSTNDFDGALNVRGNLAKLVGANSVLHGSVTAGTLGGVQVGQLHGSLATTGDMTLDLKTLNADVTVNVGGDLNLRLGYANGNASDESGFFGTIIVDGNVSGIAPVKLVKKGALQPLGEAPAFLDPINLRGTFAGSLQAGGDVADLVIVAGSGVTTGQFTGTLSSEGSIGNISAERGFSGGEEGFQSMGGSSVSANGSIGNITSLGTNSGSFFAGGDIGNITSTVTTRFADAIAQAVFVAQGSIGDISATSFNGSAIRNSHVASYGGDIGETEAIVTNLTGGDAISYVSYAALLGNVGNVFGYSAGGTGISGLLINADSVEGAVGVTGISSFGDGFRASSVTSNTTIGHIEGVAQGFSGGDGIDSLTLRANGIYNNDLQFAPLLEGGNGIGSIRGHTQGLGNGITGLDAQAAGGIAQVIGGANLFHGASGIASSKVAAGGDIGQISGSTSGTGSGLSGLTASATGQIASIIGNAYGQSGQHGIAAATFTAGAIGTVDAYSGAYGSEAITTGHFTAPQVGMISVWSNGDAGFHTITASTLGTSAAGFNYAGVQSNGSVDLTFDTCGGQGTLGRIDIVGNLDAAALQGVVNLGHFVVTGAVHGFVGNGVLNSTVAETIVVGSEQASDVTFNFAQYNGAPNGIIDGNAQTANYGPAGVRLVGTTQPL